MRTYTAPEAETAVKRALAGQGTPTDAEILVDLFRRASGKRADREAANRAIAFEAEANALAAIIADVLTGSPINSVASDLPESARRRVLAYRSKLDRARGAFAPTADLLGPLPRVPPRDSVMRDSVRMIDVDPVDEEPENRALAAIEGTVVNVVDERL